MDDEDITTSGGKWVLGEIAPNCRLCLSWFFGGMREFI